MSVKKLISMLLAAVMLTPGAGAFAREVSAESTPWREIYVEADAENGDGTKEKPFAKIEQAKEYVRTISDDMQGDIVIHIGEGTYFIDSTLIFNTEDSGKNGYRIIYEGENMPTISGGVKIRGFEKAQIHGMWKAPVEGVSMMREMYVNGRKSYVASSNRQIKGIGYYDDPKTIYEFDGMYIHRSDLGEYENPEHVEFNWQVNWKNNTCLVDDIIPDPENPEQVIALMQQDWWNMVSGFQDSGLAAKPYRGFMVKNAFELLDKPGEFYYNKKEKVVYYMPRHGEDMTTAEVIAPRVDRLLSFDGNDSDDRVKNITIKGLKLAHAAFYGPDTGGLEIAQQQNTRRTNDIPWYIPSTIYLGRADSIEFHDNYFFGFGSSGIHIWDAVDNTVINGNAFSDIGDAAIAVGNHTHGGIGTTYESVQVHPAEGAEYFNLIDGTVKLATSYYDAFGTLAGSRNWQEESEFDFSDSVVWESNPYAQKRNERSWVRYDFQAPYTIDKIQLGFSGSIDDAKRMGYEVLLSNDRNFTEGSYITVATQEQPAKRIEEYIPEKNGEKYRYLMIRTIKPQTFALSSVWVLTKDRKPYTVNVPNRDNTITNNYITRTGETVCSGGGISCFYASGLTITDNEICHIPYSGLMFGWGWSNKANGSGNNYVARNYIHSTNKTMHDGAAIYCLSRQEGTVIEENYVRSVFMGAGAYYPDEGSSYLILRNNVSEDVNRNNNLWISTIRENQILSPFGWHDINRYDGTDCIIEPVNVYLPGNETGRAYEIKKNAGLKNGYEKLRDLVPAGELEVEEPRVILDGYGENSCNEMLEWIRIVVNNMLENGSFGNMPGDYPIEYRYKLSEALNEAEFRTNKSYTDSIIKLRRLINEAADNVIRVPIDELIAMCDESLENTPVSKDKSIEGSVTSKEKNDFAGKLSAFKTRRANVKTLGDEFELLKEIEAAYRSFEDKKPGFGIEYLWVENMISEEIDPENRTIKVLMPANADISNCRIEILCEGTASSAVFEEKLSFNKEFSLPIYSESLNRYEYWRVIPEKDSKTEGWQSVATETNTAVKAADESTYLSINRIPYMNGKYFDNKTVQTVKFVPMNAGKYANIKFIFGADTAVNFERTTEYAKDNHFRIEETNGVASVYERINGVDTLIKSGIEFPVKNSEENEIKVRLIKVADKTVIAIWLNGELRINVLANRIADSGYFGFYNEKTGVKILR